MSLERLRSLSEVARKGAISEAARSLGLTQPALTRRIQQLEEELGAALLWRSRKGAALTELGRLVEEEGRYLLERYERLKETVQAHLRLEAGTVRIGGGATAVSCLLPDRIGEFRKQYPEVVFLVKEAGSREIERDVAREELEIGIVTMPVRSRELAVAPLLRDRIALVAAAGHPLARRRRVSGSALQGAPLIGFERGSAIRHLIDRALEQHGIQMRIVMELRSIQSTLRMVESGQGFAFVSELGIDRTEARVERVSVAGLKLERSLALVTRRERPLSVAAEQFAQQLRRSQAR